MIRTLTGSKIRPNNGGIFNIDYSSKKNMGLTVEERRIIEN